MSSGKLLVPRPLSTTTSATAATRSPTQSATATPTCAAARAGASLMPSPIISRPKGVCHGAALSRLLSSASLLAPCAHASSPETNLSLSFGLMSAMKVSMPSDAATCSATLARSPVSIATWSGGTPLPPARSIATALAAPSATQSSKLSATSTSGSALASAPHGMIATNDCSAELRLAAATCSASAACACPPGCSRSSTKSAPPKKT
mmetsp:Transcript_3628/g.10198  ORF Transcript_3628/g.10198 Transcript_3628/m.10198 type:complete len:207 (-) Transcript_3628:308-928(-)